MMFLTRFNPLITKEKVYRAWKPRWFCIDRLKLSYTRPTKNGSGSHYIHSHQADSFIMLNAKTKVNELPHCGIRIKVQTSLGPKTFKLRAMNQQEQHEWIATIKHSVYHLGIVPYVLKSEFRNLLQVGLRKVLFHSETFRFMVLNHIIPNVVELTDKNLLKMLRYCQKETNFYVIQSSQLRESDNKCRKCDEIDVNSLYHLESCNHQFCYSCLQQLLDDAGDDAQCTICQQQLSLEDLYHVSLQSYNGKLDQLLRRHLNQAAHLIKCPGCNSLYEAIQDSSDELVRDKIYYRLGYNSGDGDALDELTLNRLKHRYLCRNCLRNFCSKCSMLDYHEDFTCKDFHIYNLLPHCLFCDGIISNNDKQLVCNEQSCLNRYDAICKQSQSCGHQCLGVRFINCKLFGSNSSEQRCPGECVGCLFPECQPHAPYHRSHCCSICCCELSKGPCIRLSCSHLFHFDCLQRRVVNRWGNEFINFNYLHCPACNQVIDHAIFMNEIKYADKLRGLVNNLAVEQFIFEGLLDAFAADNDIPLDSLERGPFENQLVVDQANGRFIYYLCAKCNQPYFAGSKSCVVFNDEADEDELKQTRICSNCSKTGKQRCDVHGAEFIIYKCKFCCSLSKWHCWGTTHFCNDCHSKQMKGEYLTRKTPHELPQCKDASSCPLKVKHPPNGTQDFSMGCVKCRLHYVS